MFQIGEFSRIARVSSRLLRYYDELGLLRPGEVDPTTGYRYYRASQLPELNRILVLKELGFTLEEIAQVLAGPIAPADLRDLLVGRRTEIAHQLEREAERLRHIDARIAQIDDAGPTVDDVVVRAEPARILLATRATTSSFPAVVALLADVMRSARRAVRKAELGPLVVISHGDAFEPEELDLEIGHFVAGEVAPVELSRGGRLEARSLPGEPAVAICVRVGSPERAHAATGQIGRFVEQSGYRLAGPSREVFLEPPDLDRPDTAVVEMQFPVARRSQVIAPGG